MITQDSDGYQIVMSGPGGVKQWRLDFTHNKGQYVLYRSDQKPTSRGHYFVTAEDVDQWWSENEEQFAKEVQ